MTLMEMKRRTKRTQENRRETETQISEMTEMTEIMEITEYAAKGPTISPISAKRLFCSRTSNDPAYSALDSDGGSRYNLWFDFTFVSCNRIVCYPWCGEKLCENKKK
uniref:Uncharacterized protein n=1 Tax=Micrurus paraensis TaxID=1970185 RepID=A0A2D4L088_9SAUR